MRLLQNCSNLIFLWSVCAFVVPLPSGITLRRLTPPGGAGAALLLQKLVKFIVGYAELLQPLLSALLARKALGGFALKRVKAKQVKTCADRGNQQKCEQDADDQRKSEALFGSGLVRAARRLAVRWLRTRISRKSGRCVSGGGTRACVACFGSVCFREICSGR